MEEKDLHYLAVLITRKEARHPTRDRRQSGLEAKDDLRAADMVRAMLDSDDIDLASAMFDILDAIGKGFSATEIVWESSEREWFPRRLKWRDPRWFMFDWISGEELLVRSMKNEGPQLIPVEGERSPPARGSHFGGNSYFGALRGDSGIQPMTEPMLPYKFIIACGQGQGRIADSRRPRARGGMVLSLQKLRAQRLGDFCRSVRTASARREIRIGRDRAG